jgi:hypothetical protein
VESRGVRHDGGEHDAVRLAAHRRPEVEVVRVGAEQHLVLGVREGVESAGPTAIDADEPDHELAQPERGEHPARWVAEHGIRSGLRVERGSGKGGHGARLRPVDARQRPPEQRGTRRRRGARPRKLQPAQ